jgi:hypothetical protein
VLWDFVGETLPDEVISAFERLELRLNDPGDELAGALRDLLAAGLQLARGLVDWHGLAGRLEHAARELRLVIGKAPSGRLAWQTAAPQGIDEQQWAAALADLDTVVNRVGLERFTRVLSEAQKAKEIAA